MNTCINCNKEYEPKRATSKYCSDKCRKLAFLNKDIVSVPDKEQNANIVSVTDKVETVSVTTCKACGKEVNKFVCICLDCVKKGIHHDEYCDCKEYKEQ